jgi:Anti-sigma-K factor rskA
MTRPIDDPNQTDLIAGHILGDLSPEEAAHLDEAVAQTPALQEEIGAFGAVFSLLPYNLPLLEPSARLKDKILTAASNSLAEPLPGRISANSLESPPTNVVPITSPRRRSWQQWMPAISTGIAAMAVVAFGLNQFQVAQQSQQQIVALGQQLETTNNELKRLRSELQADRGTIALLSQPDTQMYPLIGITNPNSGRISTARLLARSGDRAVTLVAHDLPTLSNNQIYRLWAVATPTAAPMYCGQFRQNNGGTAQWVAPNVACTKNPTKLLITLDAPTDPTTSAGPLVMKSI